MAGVASVCRPTSWPGPRPSRKSLNWLSAPNRIPEKIRLKDIRVWVYNPRHVRTSEKAKIFLGLRGKIWRNPDDHVLPLRAVAVHAPISGLSAGLSVHGRPSTRILHRHTRLHAPLNSAAAGLAHFFTCWRLCGKHRNVCWESSLVCYLSDERLRPVIRHLMKYRPVVFHQIPFVKKEAN